MNNHISELSYKIYNENQALQDKQATYTCKIEALNNLEKEFDKMNENKDKMLKNPSINKNIN